MENKRIIVIDDDPEIRQVYQDILAPDPNHFSTRQKMSLLLDQETTSEINPNPNLQFDLTFAADGQSGFDHIKQAISQSKPFAVAFIDIRMPPGWDGMDTAAKIRKIDPHIEIAIVTAYSDRSREEIVQAVGAPDKLLFFRKPFDPEEITQLALSLTTKWNLSMDGERQRHELEISEKRFRSLVEATSDWVWEVDKNGVCVYCSPVCERIFGYSPQELLNRNIFEILLHHDQLPGFKDFFNSCIQEKNNFSGIERQAIRKDGQLIFTEASGVPVTNRSGNVIGFQGIERDITARKRTEETLIQAKISAEAANRAKSEFLANMSHEIRTPLNGVIGMTDLLMDTKLTNDQLEYAETIHNSAENLLDIIDDILDLSKIEAGKLDIEFVQFDLQQLIEEIADQFAVKAEEKGLEFIVRFDPAVPLQIIGAPGRIRQVLTNLVSNAIKFTSKGYVLLNIKYDTSTAGQTCLHISVEDTGIGIAPEKAQHIFENFTQADSSTTRQYGGTGLGLAICKQLTELMNGSIGVRSELEKGATFSFSLPLRDNGSSSALKIVSQAPPELADLRILIAEHDALIRQLLQEILNNWGIYNDAVEKGNDAITTLQKAQDHSKPFHIAILNNQLPDLDQGDLVKKIQSTANLNQPLLISIKPYSQLCDSKSLMDDGFAACLTKPIRQSHLMNTLTTVWEMQQEKLKTSACPLPEDKETPTNKPPRNTSLSQLSARVLLAEDNVVNQKVAIRLLEKMGCDVDVAENGQKAVEN